LTAVCCVADAGKQIIDDDDGFVEQIRQAIRDDDDSSAKGRSA